MALIPLKCTAAISENLAAINYNFDYLERITNGVVESKDLAQVAFSGAYNDLGGKPDLNAYATEESVLTMIGQAVAAAYTYKGTVANASALPSSATAGDMYYLTDPGKSVAWDGAQWDDISMPLSLDDYVTDAELISITSTEINNLFANVSAG